MSTPKFHSREMHADLETPVSAYLKLRGVDPWSFLLESVEGRDQWAAYSILGVGARRIFQVREGRMTITEGDKTTEVEATDALQAVRTHWQAVRPDFDCPPFVGGIFGFLAYDAVRGFENIGQKPGAAEVPDALFFEPELLAVFDNRRHSLRLYAQNSALLDEAYRRLGQWVPPHKPASGWQEPTARTSREHFEKSVEQAKEHIRAGDIIQAVISRRFEMPRVADPFDVYRGLRTINPSPYLYYFNTPEQQFAGASPEVMVRVLGGTMTVRPIAGTGPRGSDADHDAALAAKLLADPKERAEHIMLVDLGRNDVGRISKPGSVRMRDFMTVEHYSHVMHLVSEVQGQLRDDSDAFDALRVAFPAGTLSGAPKVRAMQIIDSLESTRRGLYGGAVGYFGPHGDADFGIAIRTLLALPDRFVMQVGAGIVADSDPRREAEEVDHKAQAVLRAVRWAASQRGDW